MANILLTWELGGGLGHLTLLKPIAAELLRRGHTVSVALRILNQARRLFGDLDVTYWQSPFRHSDAASLMNSPATFGQLLATIGFGDHGQLTATSAAWRSLLAAVRPDVALFDHSPTALLAAREFGFRRVLLGTGFVCPTTEPDLPRLRPPSPGDEAAAADEQRAVENASRLLAARGQPPLGSLADLYRQVDETLLCTFAELDHFGPRPAARYWGCWPDAFGQPFSWPAGSGRKVFAYLKPCPALPAVLDALARQRMPTVAYIDSLDGATQRQFSSATLQLHREPLNMRQAAAECDLAILHAGHGALAAMLLAGKPALLVPIYREQLLQAVRAQQQGYAECVTADDPAAIEPKLRLLCESERYADAARGFAARYADFHPHQAINAICCRLESLLR